MTTKGEFLRHKMQNMARWVTNEVGKEDLSVDLESDISGRSALECCTLAGALLANKKEILHRNWSGLVQQMEVELFPSAMQEVVALIQQRPSMHEKFWRYLDLFVDVAEN